MTPNTDSPPATDPSTPEAKTHPSRRWGRWAVAFVVASLLGRFALRGWVIEAYANPSASMVPTLLAGDHMFVNKSAFGPRVPFSHARIWSAPPPKRGDVVVFEFPESPSEDFVQRVVGLPGDTIEVRSGRIWLNDKPIPRCLVGRTTYVVPADGAGAADTLEGDLYAELLDDRAYLTFYAIQNASRTDAGPWTVKPGEVFVLGDNRNNSRDSREWWSGKGGGVPFELLRGPVGMIWLSPDHARTGSNVSEVPTLPTTMKVLQPQLDVCLGASPPLEPVR